VLLVLVFLYFFFSSRRRHTRFSRDWSSDVCSSDLEHHRVSRGPDPHPGITAKRAPPQLNAQSRKASASPTQRAVSSPWPPLASRSEERRVGKECRSRWS